MKRLSESAKYLGYDLDPIFAQNIVEEFVRKNAPKTPIYLRPLIYTSDLDISPRLNDIEKDFCLYGLELGDYLSSEWVRCTISSWVRQADASFPLRGKITGGYITSALAKAEAKERGFDDAIFLNHAGKVCEGSGMNIFVVKNNVIVTPSVDQDILEGITRDSVIRIAQSLGFEVIERPLDKTELFKADEVFLTGTAARVTPVRAIEQYTFSSTRPITEMIRDKFSQIVTGNDKDFESWVFRISLT